MRLILGSVLLLLLASACATTPGAPAPGPEPASASPASSPPSAAPGTPGPTELIIVLNDGAGNRRTWRLTCDPPGGDHPDPEAACRALDNHGTTALRPVPKDLRCAQVYAGPETATIRGVWRGTEVLSALSRTNSCESARWKALEGLLPPGGA